MAPVSAGTIAPEELLRLFRGDLATVHGNRSLPAENIDGTSITVKDATGASARWDSIRSLRARVESCHRHEAGRDIIVETPRASRTESRPNRGDSTRTACINASGSGPAFAYPDITGADGGTISQPAYSCSAPATASRRSCIRVARSEVDPEL